MQKYKYRKLTTLETQMVKYSANFTDIRSLSVDLKEVGRKSMDQVAKIFQNGSEIIIDPLNPKVYLLAFISVYSGDRFKYTKKICQYSVKRG